MKKQNKQTVNVPVSRLSGYAAINVALNLVESKFYELKIISLVLTGMMKRFGI